ncbi:MAG: suppressor of fused domain protein [Cyanobacteriota/Melainabacteria group bacterium]
MAKKRRPKKNSRNSEPGTISGSKDSTAPIHIPLQFNLDNTESQATFATRKKKNVREILEKELSKPITDGFDDIDLERKRRKLLAAAWRERDNIYRRILGRPSYVSPANYGPPMEDVPDDYLEQIALKEANASSDTFNPGDPTMEEQHLAVLAYGPDPTRPYWTYLTAGLASPWMQTNSQEVSGFGCEIMIKSPVDLPWASQLLRTLAFYVFNHAGQLNPGVRVSLNNPITGGSADTDSALRHAFIWYADEVPNDWYQLPSGGFGIFTAIGITDREKEYADSVEDYGTWCIQQVLRHAGHGQITDPDRACLSTQDGFAETFSIIKARADAFRETAPDESLNTDEEDCQF